jgi:chemotaxis regulatin CheY-phosphate phosphatase CheZ
MANLPGPTLISEADYEAIEAAVMESARGRWFLAEYARRNRQADTATLLKAIERIEAAVRERPAESVDRIHSDLVEMSKAIARTKAEIAAIKPDADRHGKFGEASEELDSVVQATEAATSDILACAERIQEMAWTLREQGVEGDVCDLLDAKATEVYTACSFQDLTGQRTRKVIGVLRYLEARINTMIQIWGMDGAPADTPQIRTAEDAGLLNGPAKAGQGLDQADVDMVMGPDVWRDADAAPTAVHATDDVVAVEAPAPKPQHERAMHDPLEPLMALSAEEKIALFT